MGHYFFREPRWFAEGVSQFGEAHLRHLADVQTLEERNEELTRITSCAGYANIRHFQYESTDEDALTFDRCPYDLGENFMLNVFSLIGQQAMSAALRDLYVSDRDERLPTTEEAIYNAFLTNTPADKQAAFSDLYRRLHGAAFAFPETNFDDAHGDEPTSANRVEAGGSVTGALDYFFDFDYFRFQAQVGQKYRITVQHPSLPPDWLAIYAPDGATQETRGEKSRSATPSGPEVLWAAPTAGDYYVAVRNFGGLTGAYTLNIEPVEDSPDDHGDRADSATSLTPGQAVNGTVDDSFDLDYFRFQAEQGQWVHVEVQPGTLEFLNAGLYEADGTTPALMRPEDRDTIVSGGGTHLHVIDLMSAAWSRPVSFDWIAPHAGDFILTVSGADGRVGSYSVTITTPER